jgi:hypothetical protein
VKEPALIHPPVIQVCYYELGGTGPARNILNRRLFPAIASLQCGSWINLPVADALLLLYQL